MIYLPLFYDLKLIPYDESHKITPYRYLPSICMGISIVPRGELILCHWKFFPLSQLETN